jgi:hypothetical protein
MTRSWPTGTTAVASSGRRTKTFVFYFDTVSVVGLVGLCWAGVDGLLGGLHAQVRSENPLLFLFYFLFSNSFLNSNFNSIWFAYVSIYLIILKFIKYL